MLGFLNLNKPPHWTSHDCVAKLRRILKMKRIGHGGTLDPMATGVLPIAIGTATRLLPYLPNQKAYHARIRFGVTTTTDDVEGESVREFPCPDLTLETVQPYLSRLIGSIEQIPPMYSAIQIDGQRLYKLARRGETVEIPPRLVEIYGITVLGWHEGKFPELEILIECGGGTYIRSIARDLGNLLETGGTLASLTRTASCGMKLIDSVTLEDLAERGIQDMLISPNTALAHLPNVQLSSKLVTDWFHGKKILLETVNDFSSPIAVCGEDKRFLGIGEISGEGFLYPKVVLVD